MLLTGSAGGGKSRVAAEKLHAFMLQYPGSQGLMLRKKRQSMTNSTVLFMDRTIIGKDPRVRHFSSKLRFEYENGSILAYGGMHDDEQREQIRSIGQEGQVDIAWMEEANNFDESDFNELLARMRGTKAGWGQVILTTNPDHPRHWIRLRIIIDQGGSIYYSNAGDNVYNPDTYKANLARMTGFIGLRLREGLWVRAEGAVYDVFRDDIHIIDPFAIPSDWRLIRAVDFGFAAPFVCQWWAIDGDEEGNIEGMYLYREHYLSRKTVNYHSKVIIELSGDEPIEATVCDHDAEDRATLEEHGIWTIPAVKDVSRGIQRVRDLLIGGESKTPRLKIFRNSLVERDPDRDLKGRSCSSIEEFPAYAWAAGRDGRAIRETPMKTNDHGMDTMRYAVMYADAYGVGMDAV